MKIRHQIVTLFIISVVLLSSCGTAYRISKGTKLYSKESGAVEDKIHMDKTTTGLRVEIIEKDKHFVVKKYEEDIQVANNKRETITARTSSDKVEDDFRKNIDDGIYYYPDKDASKSPFVFSSWNSSFKAITVSFKKRSNFRGPNQSEMVVKDSFPDSWTSGFSPAFAYGISRSLNIVNPSKAKTTIDLSLAFFVGIGIADINSKTTRYPVIQTSSKELYNSKGILVNIGIQKFDFGYAVGWDHMFDDDNDSWVYNGKTFGAFILGYDLFKSRE